MESSVVRWAVPEDHEAVVQLLREMHEEAQFPYRWSQRKVDTTVAQMIENRGVLVADVAGTPVGTVGLYLYEVFHSEDKVLSEAFIFVSKPHRTYWNFSKLIRGAKQVARDLGVPLNMYLETFINVEEKKRLFRRHATEIGSIFYAH